MLVQVFTGLIGTHLALLFALPGLVKVCNRSTFTRALRKASIIPHAVQGPVAHAIPMTEVVLGVWLITGVWPRAAFTTAAALLASFTAYQFLLARNGSFDCGCTGRTESGGSHTASIAGAAFNLLLATTCAIIASGRFRYPIRASEILFVSAVALVGIVAVRAVSRQAAVDEDQIVVLVDAPHLTGEPVP